MSEFTKAWSAAKRAVRVEIKSRGGFAADVAACWRVAREAIVKASPDNNWNLDEMIRQVVLAARN